MLEIIVKASEQWDEDKQEFYTLQKDIVLKLEHSLLSISKWESKYHRSFLKDGPNTVDEQIDYIRDMCTNSGTFPEDVWHTLSQENLETINRYISDPMTATVINSVDDKKPRRYGPSNNTLTAEVIYYLMIQYGIPFECQKWHINRLLMLLRVCEIKESPGRKMSPREIMAQNRALNEARKAKYHTKG